MVRKSTEDQDLFEAVKSGACGYLLKSMDADGLVEALYDLEQDIPPFAPGLAAKLLAEFARGATSPASEGPERIVSPQRSDSPASSTEQAPAHDASGSARSEEEPLSRRQTEILALVAQGLSYKEVGARIHLSPRTVKYHMAEIMQKLHLENRAQVLTYVGRTASDGEARESGS